ncbi:MAG: HD domain-containing protein [Candidatus Eremiobacteraeota bacterium]|nr:HD domain-containing protein [Candidatus Eremiobacteraeota bacterium]
MSDQANRHGTLEGNDLPREIAGVSIPDSLVCRDATNFVRGCEHPEIFNHSLRSFILAELIGAARSSKHDTELLYLATIMHDVGLVAKYHSEWDRFEVDGANVARAFIAQHGLNEVQQDTVWDAIALHSSGSIARWKKPEVALANAGIVTDVHGVYLKGLDPAAVRAALRFAPRTHFVDVFLTDLAAVAQAKPETTANTFVADVGYRMVPHFRLRNFVDELRDDDPLIAFAEPRSP